MKDATIEHDLKETILFLIIFSSIIYHDIKECYFCRERIYLATSNIATRESTSPGDS